MQFNLKRFVWSALPVALGLSAWSSVASGSPVREFLAALTGSRLFVTPSSAAKQQADAWQSSRPKDAALLRYIASQPVAQWIGGWTSDVRSAVQSTVQAAGAQGATPVFVAYNIPNRDCGSYSAGGAGDASGYANWIRQFAAGLSGRPAAVILEPDAVAQASCLSAPAQSARFAMLRDAVRVLKTAGAAVYLDGGNAHWVDAATMAGRLQSAGVDEADGFSLNVSNYMATKDNIAFGNQLSQRLGGKHYVIDTSRNGTGTANGQWCNAQGQGLGVAPTTHTGVPLVDAFLWIKAPGESDGTCNGGPPAGQWWADYALGLAQHQATAVN